MTDSTSASIWASKLIAPLQKDGSVLIEMIAERCKKRFLHRSISVVGEEELPCRRSTRPWRTMVPMNLWKSGSRFIGYAKPVTTEEEAIAFVNEIRAQHREASHNVYAYALREGQVRGIRTMASPREPLESRFWDVLQKSGIVDAVVVVTRYFGGTLLGAGGLVRAYTEGAAIAVRAARPRVMSPCSVLQMDIDYGQYGKITYILPKYHTVTLESDFGAAVRMQILIKDKYIEAFRKELTELTSATVVPYELEHRFDEIPE